MTTVLPVPQTGGDPAQVDAWLNRLRDDHRKLLDAHWWLTADYARLPAAAAAAWPRLAVGPDSEGVPVIVWERYEEDPQPEALLARDELDHDSIGVPARFIAPLPGDAAAVALHHRLAVTMSPGDPGELWDRLVAGLPAAWDGESAAESDEDGAL